MIAIEPEKDFWNICFSPDLSTYDPYDIWKSDIGVKVKQLFNAYRILGIIPAALLTFYDQVLNNEKRVFYKKQEYPVIRAFAAQILLKIYNKTKEPALLYWVEMHLDQLISQSSKGYSGYCWGLNMVWASKIRTFPKNTPFITSTPYALEALIRFQEATNNIKYQDVITSVYHFISKDLYKLIEEEHILCLSYAPGWEARPVINANSYALYSLSLLRSFLPEKSDIIQRDILRLYNYIIQQQKPDGSWLYYGDNKKGNFIDCFHSCFILKNIIKASKCVPLPANHIIVVEKGYSYLLNNFYDKQFGLFKRFTKTDKPNLIKFDLYDNAEMLNLIYLNNDLKMYNSLKDSIKRHFIKGKDIFSVINVFKSRKNKNMLRWAEMPYMYALSHSINL